MRNYTGQIQQAPCVCLAWRKRPRNTSRVELDVRLVKCFAWAQISFNAFPLILFKNLNLCTSYIKVALLPEQKKKKISFKIRYLIVLYPQILELKKIIRIGHTVAEILIVKVREINNFGNNFLFYFLYFF